MKPNDPARFARELQGDFSEVDAHLAAERIKIILASICSRDFPLRHKLFTAEMRNLLCWLLGHDLRPITDGMTKQEIRAALAVFASTGRIRFSKCARCGYER